MVSWIALTQRIEQPVRRQCFCAGLRGSGRCAPCGSDQLSNDTWWRSRSLVSLSHTCTIAGRTDKVENLPRDPIALDRGSQSGWSRQWRVTSTSSSSTANPTSRSKLRIA
jgi:hypothetical protein